MTRLKNSLVIFLLSIILFAAELAVDNGYALYNSEAPKQISLSVINPNKANELFRFFIRNKEIPFKYPIDGCYARAHEMANMAETTKVIMGKIFAEGLLQAKTKYPKYPIVQWGWHVAPIAYVKQFNGKTELMVFDPSLFDKPVGVEEWKQKMLYSADKLNSSKITSVYYGTRFQYFPRFGEGYKNNWDPNDLKGVKLTFSKYQPLQDLTITATNSHDNLNTRRAGIK